MKESTRYIGLITFHAFAIFCLVYSIKVLIEGRMFFTNWMTTHINEISVNTWGGYFYIIPIIQILLSIFLLLLAYGLFLNIKIEHIVKRAIKRLRRPDILEDPSKFNVHEVTTNDVNKLLFAFSAPAPKRRLDAGKMLLEISKEEPRKLYHKMDFFIHFLENKNIVLRNYSADIIANLIEVDKKNKFDKAFDKYFKLLSRKDSEKHVMDNAMKILKAKPHLKEKIEEKLKKHKSV